MKMHIHMKVDTALEMLHSTKSERKRVANMFGKTPERLEEILLAMKKRGEEVIMAAGCDNYDIKTGCKGHSDAE